MGLDFISVGSPSPWYTKIASPVTRGLEGWFCCDTDISRLGFNRAPGKLDAAIVGSPIIGNGYARFKGNTNFLQTQILDSLRVTIIAVARLVNPPSGGGTGGIIAGAYEGPSVTPGITGTASGVNLYFSTASLLSASATRNNGSGAVDTGAVTLDATPVTSWAMRAMRVNGTAATEVMDLTVNTKSIGASTAARALNANRMRIGSGTTSFVNETDISNVVIASEAWSDSEIAAVADQMRKRAARFGILV